MESDQDCYHELCYYTLAHPGSSFIHQHAVDAFAAQRADEHTKRITVAFALVGLYLRVERAYSGKQVQKVHTQLAGLKHPWPAFVLPEDRGSISVADVIRIPAGAGRDQMIDRWCVAVWNAYRDSHERVVALLAQHGIL